MIIHDIKEYDEKRRKLREFKEKLSIQDWDPQELNKFNKPGLKRKICWILPKKVFSEVPSQSLPRQIQTQKKEKLDLLLQQVDSLYL